MAIYPLHTSTPAFFRTTLVCMNKLAPQDFDRRFAGVAKLYGQRGLQRFREAHVVVIGVGGVGSWVVESLARCGLGALTLIDLDHVAESNINRQLQALDSTLGQAKVVALETRVKQINSSCVVNTIEEFISADNLEELLGHLPGGDHALIVDCIDHAKTKAALIAWCKRRKIPILTVGGAGSCVDPTRVRVLDLSRTENDSLLSRTRKHLRGMHGFSRNQKRRFSVPAVFSDEERLALAEAGCEAGSEVASDLSCAGYGSVVHVTAVFGFVAAGKALEMLTRDL